MTRLAEQDRGTDVRGRAHPHCFVCGSSLGGLKLHFVSRPDGSVEARFDCDAQYEGYPGIVHGGIVASLLDGAMTNCLFAQGRAALTADLHVRFRHPLVSGREAAVRARIQRDTPPLFVLSAEIVQDAQVKATAIGKFLEVDGLAR